MTMNVNKKISVREGYDQFLTHCRMMNYSQYTIRYYNGIFHMLELCFDIDTPICDVNKDLFNKFTIFVRDRGIRDTTVASYQKGLKTILYFFMGNDYMKYFKISIAYVEKQMKETYTEIELIKLLNKPDMKKCTYAEYRTWVMVNYFLATGQRLRSVLNIKVKDIDLDNMIVRLTTTKAKKAVLLPLNNELVKVMQDYLIVRKGKPDDYLFCKHNGQQMTKQGAEESIRLYNHKRGVKKTSIHLFRHTFAKMYLMAGGDVFRLQKLLCHRDINITREYLDFSTEDLQENFSELNPMEKILKKTTRGYLSKASLKQ